MEGVTLWDEWVKDEEAKTAKDNIDDDDHPGETSGGEMIGDVIGTVGSAESLVTFKAGRTGRS